MTQFAVFRSPGRDPAIPFVVQIQSSRLAHGTMRVVMALVRVTPRSPRDHRLTPHLLIHGEVVYADPLNIATLPATRLGSPLDILSDANGDRIIAALDELTSRA